MKAKQLPPIEYLRECFALGGVTGIVWKHRPASHFKNSGVQKCINSQYAHRSAGQKTSCGRGSHSYWVTRVGGFGSFLNHRIVIALCHGISVPEDMQVDHIDHDGLNNDPLNLRVVSHAGNQRNRRGAQRNNSTGTRGVTWAHHGNWGKYGAWCAYIHIDKRKVHLGYFSNKAHAISARQAAEQTHWEAS